MAQTEFTKKLFQRIRVAHRQLQNAIAGPTGFTRLPISDPARRLIRITRRSNALPVNPRNHLLKNPKEFWVGRKPRGSAHGFREANSVQEIPG